MLVDVESTQRSWGFSHGATPLGGRGTGYSFVRRIGGGAAADVFEVISPDGRRLALKLLAGIHAGSRELQVRMVREANALASIDHPNLVPVLDAGTTSEGRPYFVMPLLEGETLRDRLTRVVKIAPIDACDIACDVVAGLAAAHRRGIVHRDVKPTNVFLTSGAAIVIDFGVAKMLRGAHTEITTGNHVIGTPRYLAPEQILGAEVDQRADVYSVGLMLFEMLAGKDPFGARGATEQMRAHLYGTPASLHQCVLVSAELEAVVARAIERSPAYRWNSAAAFGLALCRARARYLRAPDVADRRRGGV